MRDTFLPLVGRPSRFVATTLFALTISYASTVFAATSCMEDCAGAGAPDMSCVQSCEEQLAQEIGECERYLLDGISLGQKCEALLSENQQIVETNTNEKEILPAPAVIKQPTATVQPTINKNTPKAIAWPDESEIKFDIASCSDGQQAAITCCKDPVQCIDDESEYSLGNMQLITALTMAGNSLSGGSIKEQCERAKKLNQFGSLANSAMAVSCQTFKGRCEDACEGSYDKYKALVEECKNPGNLPISAQQKCSSYQTALSGLRRELRSCQGLAGEVATMGLQAVSQIQASKLNELCIEQTSATSSLSGTEDFTPDCNDPANASSPFCTDCSSSDSADNPVCLPNILPSSGIVDSSNSQEYNSTASIYGDSLIDTGENSEVQQQGILFGDPVGSVQSKTVGIQRGSGGGAKGTGNGASPFSNSSPKSNERSRYKTDTIHGMIGANGGATVSNMGFQAGTGYRSSSLSDREYNAKKRMRKFNLKNFAPNIHKPLLQRAPAGQISNDVARKNSKNIFQKVSDLFYRHCKMGNFYDCRNISRQIITLPKVSNQTVLASLAQRLPASNIGSSGKLLCQNNYIKRYCRGKYNNSNCKKIKARKYCE